MTTTRRMIGGGDEKNEGNSRYERSDALLCFAHHDSSTTRSRLEIWPLALPSAAQLFLLAAVVKRSAVAVSQLFVFVFIFVFIFCFCPTFDRWKLGLDFKPALLCCCATKLLQNLIFRIDIGQIDRAYCIAWPRATLYTRFLSSRHSLILIMALSIVRSGVRSHVYA